MKVFISGQLNDKSVVRDAFEQFRRIGAHITHDWTVTDDLADKSSSPSEAGRRAAADIEGVVQSDLYVLLSDNARAGKGMYAELGAALALKETRGSPEVCVVGRLNHASIFYFHPLVRHFCSVEELLSRIERPGQLYDNLSGAQLSRSQADTDTVVRMHPKEIAATRPSVVRFSDEGCFSSVDAESG